MKKPSLFKEYYNLYKHGLTELDKVMESRWNGALQLLNLLPEDKQAVAEERLQICKACPFMSKNAEWSDEYRNVMGYYYSTKREEPHCSLCLCPIEARTLSMESNCGAEYYNSTNPEKPPLEIRWKKYEG